jgi:hypothetical protein
MLKILSLSAFYDGSGKDHDPGCRFVSLGGFAGTDKAWTDLRTAWLGVLMRHGAPISARGNPYFHCKDAMYHSGAYSSWNTERVAVLTKDLFAVIAGCGQSDMIAVTCSIKLDDYKAVKADIPDLRPPEAICLDWCFGTTLQHPARDSGVKLHFDRKERFYPILKKAWKHKDKRGSIWWAPMVTEIVEVDDMRDYPQIQAADLFAWLANRYHTKGPEDKWGRHLFATLFMKPHYHVLIDKSALLTLFDSNGNMRPDVELPSFAVKPPAGTKLQVRTE